MSHLKDLYMPLRDRSWNVLLWMFFLAIFSSCGAGEHRHAGTRVIAYISGDHMQSGTRVKAASLTHVVYAFARIRDGVPYLPSLQDEKNLYYLTGLTSLNPELKVLLAVGGWNGSQHFSDVALTDSSRRLFASRLAVMVSTYNLDGVDIDWEYPGQPGAGNVFRPEDRYNFSLLLQEIRIALDRMSFLSRHGRPYLLTVAAAANRAWLDHVIIDDVVKLADHIHLMTYDYHGGWESRTGHHTNLYTPRCEPNGNSVARSVKMFLEAGVPPGKLIVGGAFYGRWWKKVDPGNHGLCQESHGERGEIPYRLIVDSLMQKPEVQRFWDKKAHAPWLWDKKEKMFVTYDDARSLTDKVKFLKRHRLGGIMFWEYCGDHRGELLEAIVKEMYR